MKITNLTTKNKKKVFCFDIDGVICKTPKNYYKNSKPIKKAIMAINLLYDSGNKILIFTARFMGRSGENVFKAKKNQDLVAELSLLLGSVHGVDINFEWVRGHSGNVGNEFADYYATVELCDGGENLSH
jgi:ribonuclease HI